MSGPAIPPLLDAWYDEGRRVSDFLDMYHSAVVVGDDSGDAALLALAIARTQARRRRVAVGDLVGELEPLQSLVSEDDAHGISDSFLYGISLTKIGRQVDEGGNLYVLPSGTEPVLDEQIYRSDRWRRLAHGFRDAGALLLLVAPVGAAGLEALASAVDGVVVIGDGVRIGADAPVLATARPPKPALSPLHTSLSARLAAPSGAPNPPRLAPPIAAQLASTVDAAPAPAPAPARRSEPRRATAAARTAVARAAGLLAGRELLAAGVLAVVFALGGGTLFFARTSRVPSPGAPSDSASAAAASASGAAPATSSGVRAAPAGEVQAAAPAPAAPLPVVNAGDSAIAAVYAVEIMAANTQTGANLELDRYGALYPAVTVSPVAIGRDNARWFQVITGAYRDRAHADSLLRALRRRGVLAPGAGMVRRLPFALLVESSVSRELAPAAANGYASRGLPVYALLQPDGTARLYAGAFATPQQAVLLATTLRAAGLSPTLAFRTGRSF